MARETELIWQILASIVGVVFWLIILPWLFGMLRIQLARKSEPRRSPSPDGTVKGDILNSRDPVRDKEALGTLPEIRPSARQPKDPVDPPRLNIILEPPADILVSINKFRATNASDIKIFGIETSPLVCFGYRVGKTNGRTVRARRRILEYAVQGVIPDFFDERYRNGWGAPSTRMRFVRIYKHINHEIHKHANQSQYQYALDDWETDLRWLRDTYVPYFGRP